jgi:hypothetical protein
MNRAWNITRLRPELNEEQLNLTPHYFISGLVVMPDSRQRQGSEQLTRKDERSLRRLD